MDQNKTEDPKVIQLAETLKKHGFAASMYEAIKKAKSILDIKPIKREEQQENTEAQNNDFDINNKDATLNELMGEIGVTPEQVEAHKKEKLESIKMEIGSIADEIKDAEKNPEKIEKIKEELAKVKAEVDELKGNEAGNQNPENAEEYGKQS